MSARRRPPDHAQMRICVCTLCKQEAHSYPGMKHRWCGGDKAKRRRGDKRGTWQ